ncbi:interleukin-20 receptor subunit alpha [Chanos chanos]|uniref:Interleukin-20 receptor subunit alpha n=1 Tax=Chanos chanos TaxID=29144 RepID=A0A6J2W0B5_CHACN|nr:interleukin-20 receptor subunit alpha-like [Chanos chanos]
MNGINKPLQRDVLGSVVVPPRNVHFHSVNLRNIVKWHPGKGASDGTLYSVEYAIYGDEEESGTGNVVWREVRHCREIPQTQCDVTNETHILDDQYYARVKAVDSGISSKWTETDKFDPLFHTIFGPPRVKVTMVENNLRVKMKGPMRWKNAHMKRERSLWKVFPHMIYNVSIFSNKSKQTFNLLVKNDTFIFGFLEYGVEYCVSVKAFSQSNPTASVASEWKCETTPSGPPPDQMMLALLGGIIPFAVCLFGLVLAGCLVYHYLSGKQNLPESAKVAHVVEQQTLCPEKPPTIINLNLIVTNLTTGETKLTNLPALPHLVSEVEHLLPLAVQLNNVRSGPPPEPGPQEPLLGEEPAPVVSYATQNLPVNDVSNATSQDWQPDHSLSDDYGLVIREPAETPSGELLSQSLRVQILEQEGSMGEEPSAVAEVNRYKSQNTETAQEESLCDEDAEEDQVTFVDWNPETGILNIPILSQLCSELIVETVNEDENTQGEVVPILPNVLVRQVSEESSDQDTLTKMENMWGLQVMQD